MESLDGRLRGQPGDVAIGAELQGRGVDSALEDRGARKPSSFD